MPQAIAFDLLLTDTPPSSLRDVLGHGLQQVRVVLDAFTLPDVQRRDCPL